MFGLACKGLHCAGCGKGIPASLIVIIAAIVAFNSRAFDNALGRALVEIAAFIALAWVVTMVLYVVFMRKGPTIVNTKTDGIWYSEIKYMETGDDEWLAFSPRREIAPKMAAPIIIGSEVEHVDRH
jgi:hypothetical protein